MLIQVNKNPSQSQGRKMEVDTNDRNSANPSEEKVELKREIGLISATNLTLNLIIGRESISF